MANRLSQESSPYLRQHAGNPVDWYPWGDEALERARVEDKPIHLSVGYAACHWCHVMAHECFENPAIARELNDRFVNVKVDRQERPDLDDVYQKVVAMMGQGGGWPLTVFLTPSGEPFYGGTYFPPEDRYGRPGFPRLIRALSEAWTTRRTDLLRNVAQFREGYGRLDRRDEIPLEGEPPSDLPAEAARSFADHTDRVHGGLGRAPKFPNPVCYDLILRVFGRVRDPALRAAFEVTLDRMAGGGIYDHLGGGFARYSVDERWAVPHFEKMLYDNGQLVKLYADGYRATGKASWRRTFEGTIEYLLRDLRHPEGGFFASEDADSEGEEGKFYVWTPEQITAVLGPADGAIACRAYGVTSAGNFEHGATVLHRAVDLDPLQEAHLDGLRARLLAARSQRPRPLRDENVIAGWNGLAIQGLCAVFQATGSSAALEAARRAADFIAESMTAPGGGVFRVWKDGRAQVSGFLDDYAFLAHGLVDLYESCFETRYLDRARELAHVIVEKFWDDGFYYTPKDGERLVHRPRALEDNAWPSAGASSTFLLLRLSHLLGHQPFRDQAEHQLRALRGAAAQNPFGFAHLLAVEDFVTTRGPLEIVIAGPEPAAAPLVEVVHRRYLPARVLGFADDLPIGAGREAVDGKPAAYLCRGRVCGAPVTTPLDLAASLDRP